MDNCEIRRLGPDDVDTFCRIRLEALSADPHAFASHLEDWDRLPDDAWRQRLVEPVLVALRDGEPIGIIGLIRQRSSKMAHRATLVMAYVRRDVRGTGIASRLLGAVEDVAIADGIVQLELAVSADNQPAIRFYRREGFAEMGRVPGGFRHENRECDEILMVRRLTR
jgi:ribosomal protein S18 acetylase RimI-like enzyme